MSEARNNFKEIFDAVFYDKEDVIIHRKGRENVVLIPFEDYEMLKKDYKNWKKKEFVESIGKIGFNSKSFVEDGEDYSKW